MDKLIFVYLIIISLNLLIYFRLNKISIYLDIYDHPDNLRKLHKNKIPTIGGIFNCILVSIFILFFSQFYFFLFILLFTITGVYDDKYDLTPTKRLLLFSLFIILFSFFEKDFLIQILFFESIDKSIILNKFSFPLTILCVLLLTNALNMIDGANGLCSIFKISSLVIIFLFLIYSINNDLLDQKYLHNLSFLKNLIFIYLIILSIFTIFNLQGKIFLGDAGVYLSSSIISYILILTNKISLNFTTEVIFIIFLLPGIDMLRVFFLRVINKKNPFNGDRNHLHHLLLEKISNYKVIIIFILYQILSVLSYVILDNFFITLFSGILIYLIIIYKNNGFSFKN
jgi:UDP-GlcNAc:undecaprenyl-phosphate/decaprenyl-phosphate GlcNAc-1-phosphate transferase